MAGSNDLNMLLKAQVVKIRAELDVKGSLPKIKQQVDEISKKLENKPVKLKAILNVNVADLNKEFSKLNKKIVESKTIKPIKLQVKIDVVGSAKYIKKQLDDVYKTVDEFNKKYGQQVQNMHKFAQQQQKQQQSKLNQGTATKGAMPSPINTQQWVAEVRQAEAEMRKVFGKSGLFSSFEMKDAEGNLTGFTAQLEKANGVVQKVAYQWNQEAGKFMPINQQTVDTMQKHIHKATQSLHGLQSEITKLQDGAGKDNLVKQYGELEKRISHGTLTQDAVKDLQRRIKEENTLQQVIEGENKSLYEQKKLIQDIRRARDKAWSKNQDVETRQDYNNIMQNTRGDSSAENLRAQRLELSRINDEVNKRNKIEDTSLTNTKKRMQVLQQVRKLEQKTLPTDKNSRILIGEIKLMAQRAKSAQDWLDIQDRVNKVNTRHAGDALYQKSQDLQFKIEQRMRRLVDIGSMTSEQFENAMRQLPITAQTSFASLEKQYAMLNRKLERETAEMKRNADRTQILVNDKSTIRNLSGLIDSNTNSSIPELQRYIGELYKGKVETIKVGEATDALGRSVDRLQIRMAGTGKTVKTYVVDLDRANNQLRQVSQGVDYNANRNLGVFEQLKIAMARVPVWMGAMTVFYGSIRSVQAMTREILEVDKALTELRRVASDDLSIEGVFRGAVELSKELGNSVHDVMQTLNDFARTFGDFNERQLLAITNTATLMSNVSELGAQEAGETLISTMNAFNIEAEESIRIVDAFNEVDNNFAVSTKQLAEGMSKGASTAKTFGVSMEESVGHITAISSVTMESGKVIGNSLKTIYSRITTMQGAEDILNEVGISIKEIGENGEESVRPVSSILSDLGEKWHDLSDSQRQNIAVTLAGRYQLSRFLGLMNNWDTAVEATTTAISSQGSAMRENDEYLKSFEARINSLKNGFTEFSLSFGDAILSDGMMALIEMLRTLAEVATNFMDKFGALPALFLVIGGVLGKFGYLEKIHSGFTRVIDAMGSLGRRSRDTSKDLEATQRTMQNTATATAGVETAMVGATGATRTFGGVLKGALASTGIGLLFVGLGMLIEHIVSKIADAKREAEEFEKQQKKTIDAFHQFGSAQGLEEMIDQYNKLNEISNRTAEQEYEYQQLRANLVNNFPSLISEYDGEGEAILKSADAMKEELESLTALSEARAKVVAEEFRKDIEKQAKSWVKLTENIEKTTEAIKELSKNGGIEERTYYNSQSLRGMSIPDAKQGKIEINDDGSYKVTIDNTEEIAKKELKILELQQKRAESVSVINKRIAEQSLAYMEIDGIMSKLSESQIRAIEDYSKSHTKSINKRLDELVEEGATQEEIADFLERKGDSIATKASQIGVAYKDAFESIFNATDGTQSSMDNVRGAINSVSDALDENFYKWKSTEDINKQVRELAEISYDMKNAGEESFGSYIDRVEELGYSTDEATQIVGELAKEQQNAQIYQQAMKQGFEETAESIDDMNASLLEAIDLTATLLGEGASDEMKALESNITLVMLYNEELGKSAEKHWEYNEAVKGISQSLGLTEEQVMKNVENIAFLTKVTGELNPTLNETADGITTFNSLTEEQSEKLKTLGISQDDLLKKYIEHKDWQVAILDVLGILNEEREKETEKTNENTEATEQNTEVKKGNKEAIDKQKEAINQLNEKFQAFKDSSNTTDKMAWIDTIRTQLQELDGKINVTKDETGKLKLVMADGSESLFLNTLENQLSDLGINILAVEDEFGNVKLQLSDSTGSTTLLAIDQDAKDAKVSLDETVKSVDILNQKKILPNDYSQIDFTDLMKGVDDTTQKVQLLSEALEGTSQNVSALTKIKDALSELKEMASGFKTYIENALSGSVGDLSDIASNAESAKGSIDNLTKSIENLQKKSKNINISGFDRVREDIRDLNNTLKDLLETFDEVITSVKRMESSIKTSIKNAEKSVDSLGDTSEDAESKVSDAFEDMSSSVRTKTSNMITQHDNHRSAINRLAESARIAKNRISDMLTSARNAMGDLDRYIQKANRASSVGNSVPRAPRTSFFGLFGINKQSSETSNSIAGVSTTLESSFSALSDSGGSLGVSNGNGSGEGTSGTVVPSVYEGGVNLDGNYLMTAFELADLVKPNKNERDMTVYQGVISQIETKMQRITQNTEKYRDALKDVVYYQNLNLKVSKKELKSLEDRNKSIDKSLAKLKNTSKHTEKQRDKYNKLQQEYDSNLSKIYNLKNQIESVTNDIKSKSVEVFNDFVDEIVANFNKSIDKVKTEVENIDFKIDILDITMPDNIKDKTDLIVERVTELVKQQKYLKSLQDELNKQLTYAKKEYGKNSKEAKKIGEELDKVNDAMNDITLEILRSEKSIKDIRSNVANESINMLKKYYNETSKMLQGAIDKEKKSLQDAHNEKMSMYDEEIERINSVYNDKIKEMDREKSKSEYQARLDEKNAKKAELLNKIRLLSINTSLDGRRRLSEAEEELATVQEELDTLTSERREQLLREELENQRQQQIESIESTKEKEQTELDEKLARLETEKEAINQYYSDIVDNDRYWAEMRDEFVKGNFSVIGDEMAKMKDVLKDLDKNVFDSLTDGFTTISDAVEEEILRINEILIDNLNFEADEVIKKIEDLKSSLNLEKEKSKEEKKETKTVKTPKAPAKETKPKTKTTSPPKTSKKEDDGVSSLPLVKKKYAVPKGGWDKYSVVDYIKSNGYRADFSDREKLYKYLKGSGKYSGSANQNDWLLKRLKIIGLRKGGYTGDQEGLAYLHKEEQVFNKQDTKNLLDASKILRKISNVIPEMSVGNNIDKLGMASSIVNNVTYGDINITIQDGDKKQAKNIAKEIIDGLKKKGKGN